MYTVFLLLFSSHVLYFFIIRDRFASISKHIMVYLIVNSLFIALLSYIYLGIFQLIYLPVIIFLIYFIINYLSLRILINSKTTFFVIQVFYIISFFSFSFWISQNYCYGNIIWTRYLNKEILLLNILIIGLIVNTKVNGIIIEFCLKPYRKKECHENDSKKCGTIIGYLERSLIFFFVLIDVPIAIGFLIAAKSFRFGYIKEVYNRKETEYIIIGTLYSYLLGLIVSYTCKYLFVSL